MMSWFGSLNPYASPRADLAAPRQNRTWTRAEIYETVADGLVDALGVDRDKIHPGASLVRDLGAE